MKIVFLGTPDFACKPLEAIINSKHEVLAVVTQPDKPKGRKSVPTPCDVKAFAISKGLKTLSYNKIRLEGVMDLKALNPDIMVTCAYGQILTQEILDIAKYGVINIHASLLPKYRGAAPIQWSIINGDKVTGVTIMKTALGVDTGDIIEAKELKIGEAETAGELFERLSILGAQMIVKVLDDIENGTATYTKQDESQATKVGMLRREDGLIDFNIEAQALVNKIRGFNPFPVAFTRFEGKTLKIYRAEACCENGEAGKVISCDLSSGLVIATKDKSIKVLEMQLEGGKRMSAKDFIIGRKLPIGYKLGE